MYVYPHISYQEYLYAQVAKNKRKLGAVWARPKDIKLISRKLLRNAKFGICHGVRNGAEIEWFQKFTQAQVVGTEISPTCKSIDNVIHWDFHKAKDEWIGACDFIYSNSFDHSYNPELCAKTWLSCLSTHGVCIVEWWKPEPIIDATDCVSATLQEYKDIFSQPGHRTWIMDNFYNGRGQWVIAKREVALL